MPLIFDKASVYYFQRYGPLAQLAERLVDVEEVTGSSPVQSTTVKTNYKLTKNHLLQVVFLFLG